MGGVKVVAAVILSRVGWPSHRSFCVCVCVGGVGGAVQSHDWMAELREISCSLLFGSNAGCSVPRTLFICRNPTPQGGHTSCAAGPVADRRDTRIVHVLQQWANCNSICVQKLDVALFLFVEESKNSDVSSPVLGRNIALLTYRYFHQAERAAWEIPQRISLVQQVPSQEWRRPSSCCGAIRHQVFFPPAAFVANW